MQQLIRNRELVEGDRWRLVAEEEPVPGSDDLILPLDRYLEERAASNDRGSGRRGLLVDGTVPAEDLVPLLPELDLVAIRFPSFADGRGYSLARQLRLNHQYTGELRAVGNVLRDQLAYMERVGFDSYLLEEGRDPRDALHAFEEFSGYYQNAPLEQLPRIQRRARRKAA